MKLNDFEDNVFDTSRVFNLEESLLSNQFGVSVESSKDAATQWIELVPLISTPSI